MGGHTQYVSLPFWLLLTAFGVALIARRVRAPYALALVITGVGIGAARLLPHAYLDPEVLFTLFLPPLLFESALHLRIADLKRDWMPISILALVGTVASAFIVGVLFARMFGIPLAGALVFGALIAPTDPIAVIAVFKKLGAGRRLTMILEAESLFNDGVAVVLFTVVLAAATGAGLSAPQAVWQFLWYMTGGAAVGAAFGYVATRIHYGLDDPPVEITLTSIVAFGSNLCADSIHVSGVIAVIAAGLVIGNHGMPAAMSAGTRLAVTAFWEYAAFVVNSVVFLLVGIEAAYVHWSDKAAVTVGAVLIVLAGRAVVYPISGSVNRLVRRGDRSLAEPALSVAWQHVLFWGGLRGALSMALVLGIDRSFPHRDAMVAATFGVVLFSLLVQGMTLGPLLRRLGITLRSNSRSRTDKDGGRVAAEISGCQAALGEIDRLASTADCPEWSFAQIRAEYRQRLLSLEQSLGEPIQEGPSGTQQPDLAASITRAALLAERDGLWKAARDGELGDDVLRELTDRVDQKLLALDSESQHAVD